MAAIVLPSTIHDPATGTVATAAWGDAVNAAIAWLANVPRCRVYNNANIAITTGSLSALTFNSERYDTDAIHDPGTSNRLTCKTAGIYRITGTVNWDAVSAGTFRLVRIRLNGATIISSHVIAATLSAISNDITVTTEYVMAVNDYVELMVQHDRGSNLNVLSTANFSPEFMMTWVALTP